MLNWYKKLYVGDNAKKKKRQLMFKLTQEQECLMCI